MTGFSRFSAAFFATTALAGLARMAHAQSTIDLDTLTVLATKTEEKAIESLAGVSVVSDEVLDALQPTNLQQVFVGVPGVWINSRSDDPGIGFNIRGLQNFGRVAVIVDGARQNFQVAQHGPQGKVYLDPELLSDAEVSRGPVSNIYGSGAIGGVVAMNTKDADDILREGEKWGAQFHGIAGTNQGPLAGSAFFAARPNDAVDLVVGGTLRYLFDYYDGNGDLVDNVWSDTASALAKLTFRPAEGHELKFGAIRQHNTFDSGDPGDPDLLADGGTDFGNTVDTTTLTGKYSFESPTNPLIDFEITGYWNKTVQETTVKEQYAFCAAEDSDDPDLVTAYPNCPFIDFVHPGPTGPVFRPPHDGINDNAPMDFTGPVGSKSGYDLVTWGFDTHNTSRFDAFGLNNTVTVGGDYFKDDMVSTSDDDRPDAGFNMTGSGIREAYGAFAQWKAEKDDWLDIIGALRWDGFNLAGMGHESEGSRVSPKLTVGITPGGGGITVYGTYAEGYRAPTVVEAFASGQHPGAIFLFLPNPALKPEIGQTFDIGMNVRYGSVAFEGDAFRLKANMFRNDLTDYIGLSDNLSNTDACDFAQGTIYAFAGDVCYQYQNIPNARIDGVELEASYDAGEWFTMVSGSRLRGKDLDTGEGLIDVLKGRIWATAGARFFDRRLTVAPKWQRASGGSFTDDDGDLHVFDPYQLWGLTVGWQPTDDVLATLVFENLLDAEYTPYFENNASPGITVKAGLKVRVGG